MSVIQANRFDLRGRGRGRRVVRQVVTLREGMIDARRRAAVQGGWTQLGPSMDAAAVRAYYDLAPDDPRAAYPPGYAGRAIDVPPPVAGGGGPSPYYKQKFEEGPGPEDYSSYAKPAQKPGWKEFFAENQIAGLPRRRRRRGLSGLGITVAVPMSSATSWVASAGTKAVESASAAAKPAVSTADIATLISSVGTALSTAYGAYAGGKAMVAAAKANGAVLPAYAAPIPTVATAPAAPAAPSVPGWVWGLGAAAATGLIAVIVLK